MKTNAATFLAMLLVGVTMTGCATRTFYVKCQYQSARKSPLSQLRPVKVSIEIDDQRPAEERQALAERDLGFGMKGVLKSKEAVPRIVADALAKELQASGHEVIQSPSDAADVRLKVRLTRFYGTFVLVEHTVLIISEVILSREGRPDQSVLVMGTFRRQSSRTLGKGANPEKDINAALTDYVRNFSFEPVVLEALK